MCNNAMKYNKPGTVYHKAARRLLHAGLKQLTPQKLRPLGDILTYMYEIPIRELGFDMGKMDVVSQSFFNPVFYSYTANEKVSFFDFLSKLIY